MEKISIKQFHQAYALLEKAFIPAELRPHDKMLSLFKKDMFSLYGHYLNQQLAGVMLIWKLKNFVFLENFAVASSLRGQGIGTKMLKDMQTHYPDKLIILEVENPNDELSKRRIQFYQRNGYILNQFHYIQPALRENAPKIDLMLMSFQKAINISEFDHIKKEIFQIVYQQNI